MDEEIKSVRIISNIICYGPEPGANDEVEQRLTIASSGRFWFSARNYQQYREGKGFCRKTQGSIGKWKVAFLLQLISNLPRELDYVTDVGNYVIEVRYINGVKKRTSGSLIGNVFSYVYDEETEIDVTRLIRRYIPVDGIWVFDGSTSPDYDGKEAVYNFAEKWKPFFMSLETRNNFEVGLEQECQRLGFQMDDGRMFALECFELGAVYYHGDGLKDVVGKIDDIEVIGSGIFSCWTDMISMRRRHPPDLFDCGFLTCLSERLKELTRKE